MILNVSSNSNESNSESDFLPEFDPEQLEHIDEKAPIYVKRPKKHFTKKDILIEGCLNITELIDFIINQKDRHSYAILPEIYSPGPFVYGTLRSNTLSFSGPCKNASGKDIFQLKISGIIFPQAIASLTHELDSEGHKIFIVAEREHNTDFLSNYKFS